MAAAFDADPAVPVLTDEGCFAAESLSWRVPYTTKIVVATKN